LNQRFFSRQKITGGISPKGEIKNKTLEKFWILEVFSQSPEARKNKILIFFLSDLVYLVCVAKHKEG
jgi:hypothetical protein